MSRKAFWRAISACLAFTTLCGCALGPSVPQRRETLARQIVDDAVAFNEAYSRAVSAQILLNILRGRDRLPRQYLALSGISDAPSLRFQEQIGAAAIPLGEGGSPWGVGNVSIQREVQSRPGYSVAPLSAETLTKAVFQPTSPGVFQHYWLSGWPRDLLTFLMVKRITKIERERVTVFDADAAGFGACAESPLPAACAFEAEARAMLRAVGDRAPATEAADAEGLCGLVAAYTPARAVRAAPPQRGEQCPARIVVGDTTYALSLRSFDDIVYFVGELMRAPADENGVASAALSVRAAGLRGGDAVALFRLVPAPAAASESEGDPRDFFAASVVYRGERFFAGPAVGRACAAVGDGPCTDSPAAGDRSSSVLSLLAELLALNQSPESVRPPARIIVE